MGPERSEEMEHLFQLYMPNKSVSVKVFSCAYHTLYSCHQYSTAEGSAGSYCLGLEQ